MIELNKPTVSDLIKELKKLDPAKRIIIVDADTGWEIEVIRLHEYNSKYEMFGDYSEMIKP